MKKLRAFVLVLCISGPAVLNLSCAGGLLTDARDAIFGSVTAFISDATLDVLEQALTP